MTRKRKGLPQLLAINTAFLIAATETREAFIINTNLTCSVPTDKIFYLNQVP